MDATESTLRDDIATLDEQDPSLAALLCDLGQLQLDKGEIQEAQQLFQRAYELRKDDLNASTCQQPADGTTETPGSSAQHSADNGNSDGTKAASSNDVKQDSEAPSPTSTADAAAAASARAISGTLASSSGDGGSQSGSDDWETGGEWSVGLTKLKAADEFAAATTPSPAKPVVRGRGTAKASIANRVEPEWRGTASSGTRNLTHIVEIFELSRAVKSEDVERFLADFAYLGTTPNLRWVDDEHALAVFPNEDAAQLLLDDKQWKYRVRPYIDASMGALLMPMEELAPPRTVRPKTTATVARRLIGHALGDTRVRDKEGEKELAQMRRDKKEQRKQKEAATAAAWDGD